MLLSIIGFVVNSAAVYFGARAAKQEANLVQSAFIALLSVVTVFVAAKLLGIFGWIPIIGGLVSGLAVWLGTTLAAKFVLNLEWRHALQIGGVVAIVQLVLGLLFH